MKKNDDEIDPRSSMQAPRWPCLPQAHLEVHNRATVKALSWYLRRWSGFRAPGQH